MEGASPEDVLIAETGGGGGSREGVPLPAGIAADGRRQGDRAEGVPVIDLAAGKEKEGVGAPRAKEVQVIDLMAAGEEEKEGQGVDGPRAEGVPAVIDLTGESSDEEEGQQEVKWVGHYSSAQSILLVGDGDFSFSLALATGFGSGVNLVATSLDCYGLLHRSIFPLFSHFY
jgi:25S rRNA (uracil2634-N3)-methyltransferase